MSLNVALAALLALLVQSDSGPVLARLFVATSAGPYKSFSWGEQWEPIEDRGLPKGINVFSCYGPVAFAGGADGLFRSDDWGEKWRAVSSWSGGEITAFVGSSLYPLEPTMFIGTREGVFRSRDGGDRWTRIPGALMRGAVSQLAWVGPSLFVVASDGLFLSEDAGNSWRRLNHGLPETAPLSIAISQYFGSDPVGFVGTAGRGLFRTKDGGASFHPVGGASFESLTVFSLFWWEESLFAGTNSGLFVSQDAGGTWRPAAKALEDAQVLTISVPGAGTSMPSDILLGTDKGVWKSSDGALSFRKLDAKLGEPKISSFGFFPIPKSTQGGKRRK